MLNRAGVSELLQIGPSSTALKRDILLLLIGLSLAAVFTLQLWFLEHNSAFHYVTSQLRVVDPTYRPTWAAQGVIIALSLIETTLLLVLFFRVFSGPRLRLFSIVAIAISFGLMSFAALKSGVVASADPYFYAVYGKLPTWRAAYDPPLNPFHDALTPLNLFANQQVPCVYGPLWLFVDRLELSTATTVAQTLAAQRVAGIMMLLGLLWALRQARFSSALIVAVALNPWIFFEFVFNAHNDIIAVLLITLGLALAGRFPVAAAALAASAGLIKISLILPALLIFVRRPRVVERVGYGGVTVLAFALASWAWGGIPYLHALNKQFAHNVGITGLHTAGIALIVHAAFAVVAIAATVVALLYGLVSTTVAWSYFAISVRVFPWYALWGAPYALLDQRRAQVFFAFLPFMASMLTFADYSPSLFKFPILALALAVWLLTLKRIDAYALFRSAVPRGRVAMT